MTARHRSDAQLTLTASSRPCSRSPPAAWEVLDPGSSCGCSAASAKKRLRGGGIARTFRYRAAVSPGPAAAHPRVTRSWHTTSAEPMQVFFVVQGPLIWLDEGGSAVGQYDVFDYIAQAREHYERWAWAQGTSTRSCAEQQPSARASVPVRQEHTCRSRVSLKTIRRCAARVPTLPIPTMERSP